MIDWWSDLSPNRAADRLTDQLYLSGEVVGWHGSYKISGAWLTDRQTDGWTEGLTDGLNDGLTDWLTDWLPDWLADWLADWLTGWLTGWPADRLTDWPTDGRTDWLNNWMTDCRLSSDWSRGCIRGYMKDLPRDRHSVVCRSVGWLSVRGMLEPEVVSWRSVTPVRINHHSIPCWSNVWLRIQ